MRSLHVATAYLVRMYKRFFINEYAWIQQAARRFLQDPVQILEEDKQRWMVASSAATCGQRVVR